MTHNPLAIPIAAPTLEEALSRIPLAQPLADFIEYRLDYLTDFSLDNPRASVQPFIDAVDRPVILTYHPASQGEGGDCPSLHQQAAIWNSLFGLAAGKDVYFDLDLEVAERFLRQSHPVPWSRVVVSYHDFKQMPATLMDIYDRLAATPAAVLKIATLAHDISDNVSLYALLKRAEHHHRQIIALLMGEAGVMSRILAPAWGSFLSFAALRATEETAPGQLTAQTLRDLYRVPTLTADWSIVGIIGNPVRHSLSPVIHNRLFGELNMDWVYLPLWVADLKRFVSDFVNKTSRRIDWHLRGLSVTIPHKVEIIRYLDRLDTVAESVGAVNTVVIEGDELVGYNTDVAGALQPLQQRLVLKGARAVVLGAGGAARAVMCGLMQQGAQVIILARNRPQATELAERFHGQSGPLSDLAKTEYDVLINATPVGMEGPDSETLVPAEDLRPGAVVFDLVPRMGGTRLLQDAKAAGCLPVSGLEMLVYQAAKQFELWTHRTAPIAEMMRTVFHPLDKRLDQVD